MNKHLTLLMLFLWIGMLSFGQTFTGKQANSYVEGSGKVRVNQINGNIEYFEFSSAGLKSQTPNAALLKQKIGLPDKYEFKQSKTTTDHQRNLHQKFQLYYANIKVEGLSYTIHYKNGIPQSANGNVFKKEGFITHPAINENMAIDKAIAAIPAKQYRWDLDKSLYPAAELLYVPIDSTLKLCYKIDIYAIEPLARAFVYVDATNGAIVKKTNRIHDINKVGRAITKYSGDVEITTDSISSLFYLKETTRGNGINTYNMNNGINYTSATNFTDNDNNWESISEQIANDAHYGSERTYDYYMSKFGRNSIDDNGFALNSYVHYRTNFANAFWDGECMTYGDGDGMTIFPLVSMDIVAHEITHGLTSHTADLEYAYESGALNESFSDIFGISVDFYANPTTANYLMGEQVNANGTAGRSLEDPNSIGDPDTYQGNYWYSGSGDGGGVHTNSSVQNYWFYLLCEGGSGYNDLGDYYNITPIGIDMASAIAYRNLSVYLTQFSQFSDARFYSVQSAIDLYGECSVEVEAVTNAWFAVGVGEAYSNSVISSFFADKTYACSAPATIKFTNNSTNATSYQWLANGIEVSTEINPTLTFDTVGYYDISLIVSGSALCGDEPDTMTLADFITVSDLGTPTMPVRKPSSINGGSGGIYNFKFAGINHASDGADDGYMDYSCGSRADVFEGKLYDIDIVTGQYNQETVAAWLDLNNDGIFTKNEIIFTSEAFQLHKGEVFIPQGIVFNTPLRLRIGSERYNYSSSLQSMSNSYYGQYEDYSLFVEENTDAPIAYFQVSDTIVGLNTPIAFSDASLNIPTTYAWTFEGGTPATSDLPNPNVSYGALGIYAVSLTTSNEYGSSSYSRNINVSSEYIMGTDTQSTSLTGKIYDSGGKDGNYKNSENYQFLISSACAKEVVLTMQEFSSESGCDRLRIYNGTSTNDVLIKTFEGRINSPEDIVATSGSMLLVFTSDGSIVYSGFNASWVSTSLGGGRDVVADFIAPSGDVPFNHEFQLTDNSLNDPVGWIWNFGDGNLSNQQHPIHKYLTSGTFEIELVSNNCHTTDTVSKLVLVEDMPELSVVNDTIRYNVTSGDTVSNFVPVSNLSGGTLVFNGLTLRTYKQEERATISKSITDRIIGYQATSKSGDYISAEVPVYDNVENPIVIGKEIKNYAVSNEFSNLNVGLAVYEEFYYGISNIIISGGGNCAILNPFSNLSAALDTLDVLLIDDDSDWISLYISEIRNWISDGGFLIITGQLEINLYNSLLEGTGISFYSSSISSGYGILEKHALTDNITNYNITRNTYAALQFSGNAIPVIYDQYHKEHCGVTQMENGKIMAITDRAFGVFDLSIPGHTTLFNNTINWGTTQSNNNWLSVDDTTRFVEAGLTDSLRYKILSEGLIEGTYIGDMQLNSNDLDAASVILPLKLMVAGIENIDASVDTIWFPKVFVDHEDSITFRIFNKGTANLELTSISANIPEFRPVLSNMVIEPGKWSQVMVYFTPLAQQIYSCNLEIVSSDPDQPTFIIPIAGNGVNPPVMEVPVEINQVLTTDEVIEVPLTISNINGGSALAIDSIIIKNYSSNQGILSDTIQNDLTGHLIATPFNYLDRFNQFIIRNGGYVFTNSLDTLNMPDVLVLDRNAAYYLNDKYISFIDRWVNDGGGLYFNTTYANNSELTVALLNKLGVQLAAGTNNSNVRLTSQHPVVDRVNPQNLFYSYGYNLISDKGDAIIKDAGDNTYALALEHGYGRVVLTNFSSFENSNSTNTMLFAMNSMRWLANKNSWLWVSDYPSDSIQAGSDVELKLTFDASNRFAGTYEAEIKFSSNDPVTPEATVLASLIVNGVAKQAFVNDSIGFQDVFIGYPKTDSVNIYNPGTSNLIVSDINSTNETFSVNKDSFALPPRSSTWLKVTYDPASISMDNPESGYIIFENNTPNGSDTLFATGIALDAPIAEITPDNIQVTIRPGDVATEQVTIDNTLGGSPLNYEISVVYNQRNSSDMEVELKTVLDSLNSNFQQIVDLIPNRFNFSDGENGNYIRDGGNDMYDYGNYLNTNYRQGIYYSNNAISSNNYFGTNTKYFTRKYEGLFVMAADMKNVNEFYINGGLGASGSGNVDATIIRLSYNGTNYKGFVKRVYNAYDPSVNHLVIVKDDDATSHTYSHNIYDDTHQIIGLQNTARIYYLLYASQNGGYIDNNKTEEIMRSFLSAINPESWLAPELWNGTVEAGETFNLDLNINTSGLDEGDYRAAVRFFSNDPVNKVDSTIVNLKVQNNFAPELVNPIGNKVIHMTYDGEIDLNTVFSDADNDRLFFTVNSSNTDAVFPVLNNGSSLQLFPLAAGLSTITVRATDNNWDPVSYTFDVLVKANSLPVLDIQLEDIALGHLNPYHIFELDSYFSDPDGDELTYSLSTSNNLVVNCELSGNVLVVTKRQDGIVVITITAQDGKGGRVSDSFVTTAKGLETALYEMDDNAGIKTYPNPVKTMLNIILPDYSKVKSIEVVGLSGRSFINMTDGFDPEVHLNVEKLSEGLYFIIVTTTDNKLRAKFLKE